jgi:hypothetical protein
MKVNKKNVRISKNIINIIAFTIILILIELGKMSDIYGVYILLFSILTELIEINSK